MLLPSCPFFTAVLLHRFLQWPQCCLPFRDDALGRFMRMKNHHHFSCHRSVSVLSCAYVDAVGGEPCAILQEVNQSTSMSSAGTTRRVCHTGSESFSPRRSGWSYGKIKGCELFPSVQNTLPHRSECCQVRDVNS